ncbi:MAG: tRNA 4-thiouridine(8) synthase ThiI [Acidobacteria bacterium]|nr:tRNA 4-thiouridine(8) synthase ThiI [Acidobacteriota bacterium]
MSAVVVHYAELALKGRNRPWFVHALVRAIRGALRGLDVRTVHTLLGRIIVELGAAASWEEVRDRLATVPGIGNFAHADQVPLDVESITEAVRAGIRGRTVPSFRVTVRRADKRFPMSSPELERLLGRRVQEWTSWPVDLSHPALVIRVETLAETALVSFEKLKGVGGLPVGTGGRVMALLSGGIDSPVAAWRLIRRGCRADFVHFHSYPILSRTSQEKARALVERLTRYQLRSRLHLVPFGALQQQVVLAVPPPVRTVVYRRLMLRIAERLALQAGAQALVTGDAVGQVASQTLENLAAVGSVVSMPVLRPLVGMDKEEITADAQRIGTYEISIVEDEDCCTLFTPRFPATRASAERVDVAERTLDVADLVERALAGVVLEKFSFPMLQSGSFVRKEGQE